MNDNQSMNENNTSDSFNEYKKDYRNDIARYTNKINRFNIFKIILCALLLSSLFAVMTGGQIPTFAGFLEALQTAPSIPIEKLVTLAQGLPTIGGDWEVLDGLRQFINQIIELTSDVYSVAMYFVFSLYNFLLMVMWALRWLFGLM